MASKITHFTIVSGGPVYDEAFLKTNIDLSSFIIGADSGYLKLQKAGIRIDAIVADFDSAEKPALDCEMLVFPVEKDATDTFNAVKIAVERGAQSITVFFALGGRFDHSYSNLLCLAYCKAYGVDCVLLDTQNRVSLITDKKVIQKDYNAFSLFAFLEDCKGVSIKGAYYTAGFFHRDTLDIKMSDQFAQSNYVTEDVCEISVEKGTLLLIESNDL